MPTAETIAVLRFRLSLADREIAGMFGECSGLESETEVIEERSVDKTGKEVVRKVPGATRWSNIVLRRGVDRNRDLWEWRDDAVRRGPDAARTDGTIELLDYDGSVVATYRFKQGWPVKYTAADRLGTKNEVAIETIEICVENLERD
jgi:phage tail-like protein